MSYRGRTASRLTPPVDGLDQAPDDRVGVHAVGPGVEVEDQAMPEHRAGQGLHVVEIDVVLAREDRPRLAPKTRYCEARGLAP